MSILSNETTVLSQTYGELIEAIIIFDQKITERQHAALDPTWTAFEQGEEGEPPEAVIGRIRNALTEVPSWTEGDVKSQQAIAEALYGIFTVMTTMREVRNLVEDANMIYNEQKAQPSE